MPVSALAKIRILIVDDKAEVRQGLRTILQLSRDLEIVGEASNGLEAVQAAELLRPDAVLMDVEMPVVDGLEATQRIKEQYPEIGVVILTIHGSEEIREQAARAGPDAFVEKEAPTEHLIAAIREVRVTSCRKAKGDES